MTFHMSMPPQGPRGPQGIPFQLKAVGQAEPNIMEDFLSLVTSVGQRKAEHEALDLSLSRCLMTEKTLQRPTPCRQGHGRWCAKQAVLTRMKLYELEMTSYLQVAYLQTSISVLFSVYTTAALPPAHAARHLGPTAEPCGTGSFTVSYFL